MRFGRNWGFAEGGAPIFFAGIGFWGFGLVERDGLERDPRIFNGRRRVFSVVEGGIVVDLELLGVDGFWVWKNTHFSEMG